MPSLLSGDFAFTNAIAGLINRVGAEWVVYLLALLSTISIALIIERSVFLSRQTRRARPVLRELPGLLGRADTVGAERLLHNNGTLEAAVALDGLNSAGRGPGLTEEIMSSTLARERQRYEKGLGVLATMGNNAPFVGLLGTVLGIIKAFADLALDITGGAEAVMTGISQALVTTALGLLVALPAVVAFNYFTSRVKLTLRNAEVVARLVLAHSHEQAGGGGRNGEVGVAPVSRSGAESPVSVANQQGGRE